MKFENIFSEQTGLSLDRFPYVKEKIGPETEILHSFYMYNEITDIYKLFFTYPIENTQSYNEITIKKLGWDDEVNDSHYLINLIKTNRKAYHFSFFRHQYIEKGLRGQKMLKSLIDDVPIIDPVNIIHRNIFVDLPILKLTTIKDNIIGVFAREMNEIIIYRNKTNEMVADVITFAENEYLYKRDIYDLIKRNVTLKDLDDFNIEYEKQIKDENHEPQINLLNDYRTFFVNKIPKKFIEQLKEEILMELL